MSGPRTRYYLCTRVHNRVMYTPLYNTTAHFRTYESTGDQPRRWFVTYVNGRKLYAPLFRNPYHKKNITFFLENRQFNFYGRSDSLNDYPYIECWFECLKNDDGYYSMVCHYQYYDETGAYQPEIHFDFYNPDYTNDRRFIRYGSSDVFTFARQRLSSRVAYIQFKFIVLISFPDWYSTRSSFTFMINMSPNSTYQGGKFYIDNFE